MLPGRHDHVARQLERSADDCTGHHHVDRLLAHEHSARAVVDAAT